MAPLLAILQLVFALTWVVYVIYLPALAAQAGLDKRYVPMILMMDQAIFIACDWAAGVYADRVARLVGRVGKTMAMATLVSCAAFIALPWIAPSGGAAPFLLATVLWSVTSSALRAPPFVIVARHADTENAPWIAGVYLLGLGLASAAAPYLALALKGIDPRLPFAAASIALAAFVFALAHAETRAPATPAKPAVGGPLRGAALASFAIAGLLFALGFQVHFSINSAPAYQRFADASMLPWLMPVFWIGFNVAVLPATHLAKRFGAVATMVAAGVVGTLALFAAREASPLGLLVATQAVAGMAWSVVLMSAFSAALEIGRPAREGMLTGALFSVLAVAALLRLALGTSAPADVSRALPFVAWAAASAIAVMALTRRTVSR